MSFPKRLIQDVPPGAVLSRDEAQRLMEKIVKLSRADAIRVNAGGGYSANVRFADNQMSTAGGTVDLNITVQSSFGPKHAAVSTNDTSDAALERCVRQSEALA